MTGIERGERAPDVVLPRAGGAPTRLYAVAGGRPAVLAFRPSWSGAAEELRGLAGVRDRATLCVVTGDGQEEAAPTAQVAGPDVPVLCDVEGRARGAYRLPPEVVAAVVCDANLRVLAVVRDAPLVDGVRAALARIPEPAPPVEVHAQAPVLLVPDVLTLRECRELMAVWDTQGNVETGVERSGGADTGVQGARGEALDAGAKRRRDHTVTDPDLLRRLSQRVGRRVMPEVRKAFAYQATRFEGFKIACYAAATGGHFRPHRDNLSPATAHRRFALTLNLNSGYAGGHLRFPEYGNHRYRPAPGEALVFSCAHLHEVLPTTASRRFVLLSFLFSDEQPRRA